MTIEEVMKGPHLKRMVNGPSPCVIVTPLRFVPLMIVAARSERVK